MSYFGRMLEKIPQLETFVGIDGSLLCPRGNARDRNFSSKSTQLRDLRIVLYY
jgi:hypothetical protein